MSTLLDKMPPLWELDIAQPTTATAPGTVSTTSLSNGINNTSSSHTLMAWLQTALRTAIGSIHHPPNTPPPIPTTIASTHLCPNFVRALQSLTLVEETTQQRQRHKNGVDEDGNQHSPTEDDDDDDEEDEDDDDDVHERRRKRRKRNQVRRYLLDPYKVWFPATTISDEDNNTSRDSNSNGGILWDENQDDIPSTVGGKLAVVSVGGILNGLAGHVVCTTPNANPKVLLKQAVLSGVANQIAQSLGGITILHLHAIATSLHMSIAQQVKLDILRTTPQRIQSLLASDLTPTEFASIRRRVYDTVILGKGMNQATDDTMLLLADIPTAASGAVHDIEKFHKCPICGNNDQSEFILDRKDGDITCSNCGAVVSESIMHEGSQFRKFEGEVDRNHHGDAANPLYSNAHNMGTSLSGVAPTTGAGMGGRGSGSNKRNLETILKNAHAYTELNVSQFGKTDRRTRIGYKDRQKKDAFIQMTHAGDALNLHEAVVQRAKELFAGFRDDRELIQQFKGVLAACLCEAFEQLSKEGRHLLRQQQQMQDQQERQYAMAKGDGEGGKPKIISARASRRSELHHATLAGKGGLLLNKPISKTLSSPSVAGNNGGSDDTNSSTNSGFQEKPAASWDLEDCRSWLLEASRTIAQYWVDERKKNTSVSKTIPSGTLGELEGKLVEHAIRLCEQLETELQSHAEMNNGSHPKRVVTPRLNDMTKLGIKWQHSHERGSGGKGGVGGSGASSSISQKGSGRTAGQILILKTAKKLGLILNDLVAGEAIHRELRGVIGKQEALKQKEMRDEATKQRLNQMQRKPWLAARVQQDE